MTLYENILLDAIYILFPILIYWLFVVYNKSIDKEENKLVLDICLVTSTYLLIKFGSTLEYVTPILLINLPLIIAYYHKRSFLIMSISFFIITYQYINFDTNVVVLTIEYIIYYIIFCIFKSKSYSTLQFCIIFSFIKIITFIMYFINYNIGFIVNHIVIFILIVILAKYMLLKTDKVMQFYMTVKELEQEKQIRNSLFKITHEIKNPLAVCKGYLDMFDVNNINHAKKYVPIMKKEIEKTLIILQDLLNFTKIKIEKDILDINYLLEDIVESLKPLLKEKNIKLEENILDKEIYIDGDYNRLCQVMINIIKNSIEALNEINNPLIRVISQLKNNNIEIIIADNGPGIKEDEMSKILEPFYTTKKDGTGLGISMSLEIIKSHSGTMRYTSKNGTEVTISLPINKLFNNNYDQ